MGTSGEGGGGSGDEESPKNNFYHLEYGRDHGPDHLHKGKLKIYFSQAEIFHYSETVHTVILSLLEI